MRIKSFLRLLNRKINKYDKAVSNPFEPTPINITLVWIDEEETSSKNSNTELQK